MEKVIKRNDWSVLYQIERPPFSAYTPPIFVKLGVKFCPCCKREYAVRFTDEFNCLRCGFKHIIKTPFLVKVKNLIRIT